MSAQPLIVAERLSKRYGTVVALDEVSLSIHDGVTGILGENGAGKSTAIKTFLGLLAPTGGTVRVLGQNPLQNFDVRTRLGYMPEHDCLPTQVSAAEFLTHMAEASGLPPIAARTRAADTLRHTGLFEERYRAIGGYSTGMKQRVKLAQALVHDPVFVFLDEPTAGLDPRGREEMLMLVRKTHKEFGISVLLSSHLMSDVERTCDRIIVLHGGHVEQSGEVGQFTQETEGVFVEVDGNRDALLAALARRGIQAEIEQGGVSVSGTEQVYDHVRDALVEAAAPLRRMAPRRRTLTELFEKKLSIGQLRPEARSAEGRSDNELSIAQLRPEVSYVAGAPQDGLRAEGRRDNKS